MTPVAGDWLNQPATQRVFDAYEGAGFRLFFVGGCVRNALLDVPVSDLDLASDALPAVAQEFLARVGFKVVPTGIDHGTLTVISDGIAHEITTFRNDIETDGRHAVVAFSETLEDDARRRDFTINALYADRDGNVLDPVGGLQDVSERRVRFVGDAEARICEDYLRTLRFFRFHAWYDARQDGFDPDTLSAIAATLDGLTQLSRERVGAEFLKLLAAPDPGPEVAVMAQIGVLVQLLPEAQMVALPPLIALEAELQLAPDPIRRLAALVGRDEAETLRLSRRQLRGLEMLRLWAGSLASPKELGYRLGSDAGAGALALRYASLGQLAPERARYDIDRGAAAEFPVTASDLASDFSGKALGDQLRKLEAEWIASDFTLTKSGLLS